MGEDSFKPLEEPKTPDIMDEERSVAGAMEPLRLDKLSSRDQGDFEETVLLRPVPKDQNAKQAFENASETDRLNILYEDALRNGNHIQAQKYLKQIVHRSRSNFKEDRK